MKLDQYFTAPRFFQLLKIEAYLGYRKLLILGAATFAFLLMIALINGADRDFEDFHTIFYPILLLGGGFLFTSRVFNEMNTGKDRMFYLGLPASNLEKIAAKWFLSAIIYTVIITLAYWLFASLTDAILLRFWDFEFDAFNPLSNLNRLMISLYIVIQAAFLAGAIAFNKYAFPKTILSIAIIGILLVIIAFTLFRITFHEIFDGLFTPVKNQPPLRPSKALEEFIIGPLWNTVQYFFWFVLAPVLWVVSYFKLKEREV